jgi:hypothetical protein
MPLGGENVQRTDRDARESPERFSSLDDNREDRSPTPTSISDGAVEVVSPARSTRAIAPGSPIARHQGLLQLFTFRLTETSRRKRMQITLQVGKLKTLSSRTSQLFPFALGRPLPGGTILPAVPARPISRSRLWRIGACAPICPRFVPSSHPCRYFCAVLRPSHSCRGVLCVHRSPPNPAGSHSLSCSW